MDSTHVPYCLGGRIWIRIKMKILTPGPHQYEMQDLDPHQNEKPDSHLDKNSDPDLHKKKLWIPSTDRNSKTFIHFLSSFILLSKILRPLKLKIYI
jgi:hypothetical protein